MRCLCLSALAVLALGCSLERTGVVPRPGGCQGAGCAAPPDAAVPPPTARCGDGACDAGEDCASCAADCGACPGECDGASTNVDYGADVQPIFDARCAGCHGPRDAEAGLRLDSLLGLLAGSERGPVISRCDCRSSRLWARIAPTAPAGERMPLGGAPLAAEELDRICRWIDEGAEARFDPATCGVAVGPPRGACDACGDGVCGPGESCAACPEDCECAPPVGPDVTPPVFEGARDAAARSRTECVVSWRPAIDDVTPEGAIVYEVFAGPREAPDLTRPLATTAPGAISHVLTLRRGDRVDVVVRAVDAAGNRDDNVRARECDMR